MDVYTLQKEERDKKRHRFDISASVISTTSLSFSLYTYICSMDVCTFEKKEKESERHCCDISASVMSTVSSLIQTPSAANWPTGRYTQTVRVTKEHANGAVRRCFVPSHRLGS